VSPDGRIGFNYEHSAAEGPPIVHLVDACWTNLLVLFYETVIIQLTFSHVTITGSPAGLSRVNGVRRSSAET